MFNKSLVLGIGAIVILGGIMYFLSASDDSSPMQDMTGTTTSEMMDEVDVDAEKEVAGEESAVAAPAKNATSPATPKAPATGELESVDTPTNNPSTPPASVPAVTSGPSVEETLSDLDTLFDDNYDDSGLDSEFNDSDVTSLTDSYDI